jgi:type I restriction enzyme, S subunit
MSEWKNDVLANHVSLITKGTTPSSLGKDFKESGINFIKAESITDDGKYTPSAFAFIDADTHELLKRSQLHSGDILFSIAGVLGRVALVNNDILPANTNQALALIRLSNISVIRKEFLMYALKSEFVKDQIRRINVQAAQANFSLRDINRLKINYPLDISEQRRIAYILTTCDTVIEQTQVAIAKYKAIKHGLLHDLFTRGLDANGHLRPGYQYAQDLYKVSELGMIPKEWEVKRLEEISTMKSGDGITSQYINDSDDFPVYGGNGLRGFTTSFTHHGDFVLIGRQGALCGNITRVSGKFFASEHAVVVTVNKDMDVDWLSQKLDNMNLNQYSEASAQPGLAVAKIMRLFITKPPHKEQIEIGKRLLALDNKMNSEENLLQKYQSIKKGLMGDLLGGKKAI